MWIVETVNSKANQKAFHEVAQNIYEADPHWIAPLHKEIDQIFSQTHNPYFKHGDAKRWVIRNQQGKPVGRIAAFVNEPKAQVKDVPTGGVGFFECIDNHEVAHKLFELAKSWLVAKGMQAMEGPINLSENDRYWGLLVEGFSQPVYGINYNSAYYRELFEAYGFVPLYEQYSFKLDLTRPIPERLVRVSEWIAKKPYIKVQFGTKDNLKTFASVVQQVYNRTWHFKEDFTPLTDEAIKRFVADFRHVAIPAFLPYVTVRGVPAAFLVAIPDLNQLFGHLGGRLPLWQQVLFKIRSRNQFNWYLQKGILTRGRVWVLGVDPAYQRYGLEAAMIVPSMKWSRKLVFKEMELGWVGDFNIKMQRLQGALEAVQTRKHITYYYAF